MIMRSTPCTQLAGAPGEAIEDVSCLGVGLIIRTAAEAEVDAFLDRPRLSTHRRCGSADWLPYRLCLSRFLQRPVATGR